MKRSARARWEGSLKEDKGTFAVASGAIQATPFSFKTRFEGAAAAKAGCPISKVLGLEIELDLQIAS